jgi:tetratricopeptide (TPR) repeat protein
VKEYGTELFEQVFGDRRAFAAYQRVAGNLSQLEIMIQGDPAFQGLHWEALWDGDMPRPLALDAVVVRQRRGLNGGGPVVVRQDATVLNLLVVTARPNEGQDVGYRTISRPLVAAIANAQLPVNVEFVRPGTYEAFVQQLAARGEGYYHMVHFDLHGGLMTFEQFQAQREAQSQTFQRGYDLPELKAYEGVQAFLFFEGDETGQAIGVTAQELSDRLKTYGIAACVLNACQSAKQVQPSPLAPLPEGEGNTAIAVTETSLGARLMDAGMRMVVAMAYSVTVDAAKLLVTQLYGELFAGVAIDRALQRARRALHGRKERSVYFGQKVDLEDWLLPVVYRNQNVDLKLRRMYPEEQEAYFAAAGARFQFGQGFRTEYGFVGRDLEILQIERGLIREGNVLMLYGMGGTGKTTLLQYLRDWWVQTGFVAGVSYFGYDDRAWTLPQILFNVARDVLTEVELRSFQAMPQIAQVGQLAQVLRSRDWLIVLDNLESVTGQALAIMNTLVEPEQEAIRDFLLRLVGGRTRVILGSRRREPWLAGVYGGNEYELRGLDQQARSDLAEKVLERHIKDGAKRRAVLADREFKQLMKLLAGYPLAIEVVLGNLGRQSVGEVLRGLDAADVQLDRAGSKTESILQCVEYSHRNLSVAAQEALLCLAPFSGFLVRGLLEQYVDELKKLEPFRDYQFADLDRAISEAINWGLLSPHEMGIPDLLTIQPVFPYFLKTKLAAQDKAFQLALRLGFKNHYEGLAGSYQQLMQSKEPQERQLGIVFCKWEYENLYAALSIALEQQESVAIYFCLSTYCDHNQDIQLKQSLSEEVAETHKAYSHEIITGKIGLEVIMVLDRLANCYLMTKQYKDSRDSYQRVLTLLSTLQGVDLRQIQSAQAITYHQLGRVAEELREFDEARNNYQQALQINIEFNDRYEQAGTYHQLGIVAEELREFDEARKNYQQALQIYIEFNDRYEQADTYHQLGIVAQELREFDEARKNYQQALQIFIEFNDRYSQARTYHQLGIVAQELREFDEARNNYQQALQIYIEFNDRYEQAGTYHQLGMVAQELREFDEARNNYQQALQIKIEFNDRYEQAGTYHQLGMVAQELQEFDEARTNYLKALVIYVEFNDWHNLAIVVRSCGRIYKTQPSPQFLTQISQGLGTSEAEVLQLFAATPTE